MAEVGEERVSVGAVPSGVSSGGDRYSDGVDEEEDYNDESFSAEEPEPAPAQQQQVGSACPSLDSLSACL
eukprot:COSAG02_NODE_1056_length_14925_cov_84.064212_13_plen_70_part_00